MIVTYKGHKIYLGPNPSKQCKRRWEGTMSPEPETVAWIESLQPKGVFYDIGANIGRFSIMASILGHEVHAFEPYEPLYRECADLVNRNGLLITMWDLAFADWYGYGTLDRGRSHFTVYPPKEIEKPNAIYTNVYTLDEFIRRFPETAPSPDYIKLDVDGNELQVLKGAEKTLKTVKSLLVEVDPVVPGHDTIPKFLTDRGFTFDANQVNACTIMDGKYRGTANWIFWKKQ